MPDSMAVKFVDGSDSIIEGLAIPFGGPAYLGGKDLHGEAFGPDTDFVFEMYPHGRPVIYDHGMDGQMKVAVQGRQFEHEMIDEGVWARVQLDKSAKYHATVSKLVAQGKLFFSSGTAPQMVQSESGHIRQWPWMELSLTTSPANPLAVVHAVKTADHIEHLNAVGLDVPADLIAKALKALDEPDLESPPAPVAEPTYAELTELVAAHVKAWAQATTDRIEFRAKEGRGLTAAELERVRESHAVLTDALKQASRTPEAEAEARAIEAEYLRLQSRMLGVAI